MYYQVVYSIVGQVTNVYAEKLFTAASDFDIAVHNHYA